MKAYSAQHGQRGVALIVSLIMLLAITLVVVSASNLVQSNLKVVQNMESRDMVRFAAYAALEEAISSGRFTASPESVFDESCEVANQKCYDFNGDGNPDLAVSGNSYNYYSGRVHIFYNTGSGIPDKDLAAGDSADTTLTGEINSSFGEALAE